MGEDSDNDDDVGGIEDSDCRVSNPETMPCRSSMMGIGWRQQGLSSCCTQGLFRWIGSEVQTRAGEHGTFSAGREMPPGLPGAPRKRDSVQSRQPGDVALVESAVGDLISGETTTLSVSLAALAAEFSSERAALCTSPRLA